MLNKEIPKTGGVECKPLHSKEVIYVHTMAIVVSVTIAKFTSYILVGTSRKDSVKVK